MAERHKKEITQIRMDQPLKDRVERYRGRLKKRMLEIHGEADVSFSEAARSLMVRGLEAEKL